MRERGRENRERLLSCKGVLADCSEHDYCMFSTLSLSLSLSLFLSRTPSLSLALPHSFCLSLSLYVQVSGVVADCSKDDDREKLVRDCSAYFDGQLDVLVNNVGTNIR